ncbi:MAG: phosphate/phosphite/phosphonate ABC transporter substrate-binding protein [Anaerolineae bacterium]|nr:phosphate/phosphite/phosphonate ABC transporter substrate-binding protein [Anaerolineae bacterium]
MNYRPKLVALLIAVALILSIVGQFNIPVAAQSEEPVIWAFVPSENSQEVLASADAIAALVTEKTNIPIKTFVATEFAGVVEAMCNGQAQMGALNTFGYVLASSRQCADVGLVSVRNGSTSYRGQIITLADSGIKTIADLKGKTFCRPDPLSTSGWIIPSILLKANGINPDTDLEVVDVGGHDAVVENVYNGNCAAGATFDDARGQVEATYADVREKVVVVEYTAAIPNDTVSFAPSFDSEKRAAIVKALLEIVGDEANADLVRSVYNWTGLAEAKDAFFDDFRQQLDAAGVSIDTLVPTPEPTSEATAEATAEATP